jgi:hypothetical protein
MANCHFLSLSLPKMLSGANAFEIRDLERMMNIGAHQPGAKRYAQIVGAETASVTSNRSAPHPGEFAIGLTIEGSG